MGSHTEDLRQRGEVSFKALKRLTMMRVQLLALVIVALSISVSTTMGNEENHPGLAIVLANATNHFAVNMFKALPRQENAFFSPLSIASVLAMAYSGAGGSTFQELHNALGYEHANLIDIQVRSAFKQLLQILNDQSINKYTLNLASKALTARNFDIYEDYINAIREYFDVELDQVDFGRDGETIKNDVNNWINEKSNGKIPAMLDSPPDPLTAMLLLNAIYFNATWKNHFSLVSTKPGTFYNAGTEPKTKLMMFDVRAANYTHSEELSCKALELPYTGDHLSMLFILPDANDGIEELESKLTSENLQQLVDDLEETPRVQIKIPPFKLEHTYNLEEVLPNVGIVKAFDRLDANFTYISSQKISISKVLHKAFVRVGEQGTEASAATLTQFALASALVPVNVETSFIADHPFVFTVLDKATNQMLFFGRTYTL